MEPQECINNITILFCFVDFISMMVFFRHIYIMLFYIYVTLFITI